MNKIGLIFGLICFTVLQFHSVKCLSDEDSHFIPLNFGQAISKIHARKQFHENDAKKEFVSMLSDYEPSSEKLYDLFEKIAAIDSLDKMLANVTKECSQQFSNFTLQLVSKNKTDWAVQAFDAYGKPTSGVLQGGGFWLGDYSECVSIQNPWWTGKYCKLSAKILFGMCLPKTCSENDVVQTLNLLIDFIAGNSSLNPLGPSSVTCQEDEPKLDWPAAITLALILIILAMALAGTAIDASRIYLKTKSLLDMRINEEETENLIKTRSEQPSHDPLLIKILLSFSLYTNSMKVFNTANMEGQLECLNAIRYLSIGWVILGHTYAFLISLADNVAVIYPQWLSRFSFQLVSNATPSVDSFFLLSGLLTAFLFMKETSKGNWFNFSFMSKYYIHRYIRLTPPYMIAIAINLNLTKYLGSGPLYPAAGFEVPDCKTTWWWNLLYINNFLTSSKVVSLGIWFHWFAPIILVPLAYKSSFRLNIYRNLSTSTTQLVAIAISVFLIGACIVSRALIIYHHPGFENGLLDPENGRFMDLVYVKPWSRMGPFIVGLLLGYLIHLQKTKQISLTIRREFNLLLWAASITLLGLIMFGLYEDFNGNPLTRVQHILYQATFRILWAVGLSYVIFACLTSQGGFINQMLSWKVWIPLSRLSFSAYLVHIAVISYCMSTTERPFHFQDFNVAMMYISILVVSFCVAFVFSVLFELPILSLEKLIFKRK